MSSYIWTKYIFETHDLKSGQDHTECGVRCELSSSHCDFFTVASGKCYLGRYSYWGSGTVSDSNVPQTYHKSGSEIFLFLSHHFTKKCIILGWSTPHIYTPNYYYYYDTYSWAKWVYKYEWTSNYRKCDFECYHDSSCDYYVKVHSYCLYGRFTYTGGQIIHWTDNTYVYVRNGKFCCIFVKSIFI